MRPAGLEPATHSLEGCCSIHLSYGRVRLFNNLEESARTATEFVTGFASEASPVLQDVYHWRMTGVPEQRSPLIRAAASGVAATPRRKIRAPSRQTEY